jgi:sugar O-acyltransferase (sialic acid O-acetyltransferase NeuD family)
MQIGIYGAGGFGREIFEMSSKSNLTECIDDTFFIDDFRIEGESIFETECVTWQEFQERSSHPKIIIGVGAPQLRKMLRERVFKSGIPLQSIISSHANISKFAELEEGVVVSAGVTIANRCLVGTNTAINLNSIIGHDVQVGSDSSISSQVNIGGGVCIGNSTYLGMGSLIREGLKIGDNSVVGMGSIVFSDIPDGVIAVGNPARIVKKNDNGIQFNQSTAK